jgi:hypothetical protein
MKHKQCLKIKHAPPCSRMQSLTMHDWTCFPAQCHFLYTSSSVELFFNSHNYYWDLILSVLKFHIFFKVKCLFPITCNLFELVYYNEKRNYLQNLNSWVQEKD